MTKRESCFGLRHSSLIRVSGFGFRSFPPASVPSSGLLPTAYCLLFLPGCGKPPEKSLILVVSGDTAGWITPCGCTSNQSGGLLRRATYLNQLAGAAEVVYADAGGAVAGASDYHRVKLEAILQGEKMMGVAAHNLGAGEARLGAAYLRQLIQRLSVPLISANLRDASGQLIAEPARLLTVKGVRLAFTGVLSPRLAPRDLKAADPRQAIEEAIAPLKGQYDSLIVLAYLPEEELQQLTAALPEADAIIGGPTGQSITPHPIGPTILAAATNKGKFLVELTRSPAGERPAWSGQVVEMGPRFADHPEQLKNVQAYLAVLAQRDFAAEETGFVPALPPGLPAGYRIAGSAACQECHEADQKLWDESKHAHSRDPLDAKGFHVDSYCQQCHTTGYALPGGFVSARRTPSLINVGCENCHGPSAAHVADTKVKTPFKAADQCVRCHDHENSPRFAYEKYWKDIRHGEVKATKTRPATRPAAPDSALGALGALGVSGAARDRDDTQ